MTASELKANLHHLIDRIENVVLLEEYYSEIKKMLQISGSKKWESLTEEQQKEVLLSFIESEDESMLVGHDEVMKLYSKWL
jgi:hypothetical protein